MQSFIRIFLIALSFAAAITFPLRAQSILRDAETEAFLRDVTDPIFVAANLQPGSVQIGLIYDNSINAFAAGGRYIFVNSGLWMKADHAGELIGVLAHETGHIAGRHYARGKDAYQAAGVMTVLSMVLGAAAIAAGGGDAGIGLLLAGQTAGQRSILAYSRAQESATDQAGANYLNKIGMSGKGMISFFEKLRDQEILAQVRQDPYVRSHPLNRDRIQALTNVLQQSPHWDTEIDPAIEEKFQRLKAKLAGYILEPQQTLRRYPVSDTSLAARYARVYAYNKALEWNLALAEADALIAAEPDNPYFHEIKGQILFENGKVQESLPVLEKAAALSKQQPLIMTAYGQALVSQENAAMMAQAVPILEKAVKTDSSNSFAWFNLARAYSWLDRPADASLATAERFYALGVAPQALRHATLAMRQFKPGSPEYLRAQDIQFIAQEAVDAYEKQQRRQRRRIAVSHSH